MNTKENCYKVRTYFFACPPSEDENGYSIDWYPARGFVTTENARDAFMAGRYMEKAIENENTFELRLARQAVYVSVYTDDGDLVMWDMKGYRGVEFVPADRLEDDLADGVCREIVWKVPQFPEGERCPRPASGSSSSRPGPPRAPGRPGRPPAWATGRP